MIHTVFFLTSLSLVFIAELGDKTQLVAMAFAAKYAAWKVLVGVLAAVALLNTIAVLLGSFITSIVPLSIIRLIAAVVFILFGIINLREEGDDEEERRFKFGAILTVALTFFIGELGDKTQLMTITLSAQYGAPYAIFLGSTVGMLIADSLGIVIGSTVFKKIPQKVVKAVSSAIFIFFGSVGLYNSVPYSYISPLSITLYVLVLLTIIVAIYRYNNRNRRLKPN